MIAVAQRLQGKRILDGKRHSRVGELRRNQLRLGQQIFGINAAGSLVAQLHFHRRQGGQHSDLDRQGARLLVELGTSEVLERLSQAPIRQIESAAFGLRQGTRVEPYSPFDEIHGLLRKWSYGDSRAR